MPRGLIICFWDETKGIRTITQYPHDVHISDANLIHLYAHHIAKENAPSFLVETIIDNTKYLSYRSGPDGNYYFVLVIDRKERTDNYEDGYIESLQLIIQNLHNNEYLDNIALFYNAVERYYMLNDEQKLSWLFQNDLRRIILDILRKTAVIEKSHLVRKIEEIYEGGFFDVEPTLMGLEKLGIIRMGMIEGNLWIFFLKDIIFERIPPVDQFDSIDTRGLPSALKHSYQKEVTKFFSGYLPSDEDALQIIEKVILDTQIYELLKLLRVAVITRSDFENLASKGVRDVDYILKTLYENDLIIVIQGEDKKEYYCLKSDFYVKSFFPSYLLNIVKIIYENKMENRVALTREVQLLKMIYSELFLALKERTRKKKREIEEEILRNY
ncbi:MAG: hypothetical protein JW776_14130 [Candidatus Lokiarchaeota archaeon]|nr:hypothetical protein [Candidatus Lokiarchaeota archaeon]